MKVTQRNNGDHPSSSHPQTATDVDRLPPRSMREMLVLYVFRDIKGSKGHFHSLVHFCRKREGNSPLLLYYNLPTCEVSQFPH